MKNGRDDGDDDPKVTNISDARRRAAEKARATQRGSRGPGGQRRGPRSVQEWLMGGLIMAMAAGMIGYAVLHVLRALGAVAK